MKTLAENLAEKKQRSAERKKKNRTVNLTPQREYRRGYVEYNKTPLGKKYAGKRRKFEAEKRQESAEKIRKNARARRYAEHRSSEKKQRKIRYQKNRTPELQRSRSYYLLNKDRRRQYFADS